MSMYFPEIPPERSAYKAEAYERGLGYTKENAESLIEQIHTAVACRTVLPFGRQVKTRGRFSCLPDLV